ncbi:MAG: hypothetical protein EP330_21910 [Deltaproteobacteria bacterium]|nr:MAG: hypothetical protein EP330_21910 [Deltaproteobacteria bacterium]
MKQSAAVRPDPSYQRKAAIAFGGAFDHTGKVQVEGIPNFDLDRTIFQTLEGTAARKVMAARVGKEVHWDEAPAAEVQKAYDETREKVELPPIDPALLGFMIEECDFDVEHADGSFLDHLYFGYEYTVQHYPQHSALVMLLHSILGTGTNTFAMTADKMPRLRELMDDFEWRQVEAFPSILRLLYAGPLREELRANTHRADDLVSIKMHRVIDNEPIEMTGEDLWIALNYQLIHLVDFLPVSNWSTHQNDTSFIIFRDLFDMVRKAGKLEANIEYTPANGGSRERESTGLVGWLSTLIPVSVSERMTRKSIARFSERIGHSLDYEITWR